MTRLLLIPFFLGLLSACQSGPRSILPEGDLAAMRYQLTSIEEDLIRAEDASGRLSAARLCLRLAAEETERRGRRAAAERGLKHCVRLETLAPERVEGPYYTAVLIGRRLQNMSLPGPSAIAEMLAAAEKAEELDADYDYAGPLRFLGLLYAKAPPWPVSIGDLEEAEAYLKRALERAPGYPENWLAMAELLIEDDREDEARKLVAKARTLLTKTRPPPWTERDRVVMQANLEALEGQLLTDQ